MANDLSTSVLPTARQPSLKAKRDGLTLKRMLGLAVSGLALGQSGMSPFCAVDACTLGPLPRDSGPSSWPQLNLSQVTQALEDPPFLRRMRKGEHVTGFAYAYQMPFMRIVDDPCRYAPPYWNLPVVKPCEDAFADMEHAAYAMPSLQLASVGHEAVSAARDNLRATMRAIDRTYLAFADDVDIGDRVRLAMARCDMGQLATLAQGLTHYSDRFRRMAEDIKLHVFAPADAIWVSNTSDFELDKFCNFIANEALVQNRSVASRLGTDQLFAFPGDSGALVCERLIRRGSESDIEEKLSDEAHRSGSLSAGLQSLVDAMQEARYHTRHRLVLESGHT